MEDWDKILQAAAGRIVELALAEDLDEAGDITSSSIFGPEDRGAAVVVTREQCTVSGLIPAAKVCRQLDGGLVWLPLVEDSQQVPSGAGIARLEGRIASILAAERTILNFLARLSGIATMTHDLVSSLEDYPTKVASTRKTSPGMRVLEKQAAVDGGGELHRLGLYDAVLIKDNHIAAAGGVKASVDSVRDSLGTTVPIEVEVESEEQLLEAVKAGVGRVLLDNMSPEEVRRCVELAEGRVVVEASGRINIKKARAYAAAGADIISVGYITSSAVSIDLSLEME